MRGWKKNLCVSVCIGGLVLLFPGYSAEGEGRRGEESAEIVLNEYNKSLLALVMWREARGEGLHGMRAVGHVVRNRVGEWGQTWAQVMTAPKQFSAMCCAGNGQLVVWGDPHQVGFSDCMDVAEMIYEGRDTDPTGGAMWYWNPATATDEWFRENIAGRPEEHPRTAVIGRHEFFR